MTYQTDNAGATILIDENGESRMLANFTARVTKETRYIDGERSRTVFTVEGYRITINDDREEVKDEFPAIEIDSNDFASMNWVLNEWGVAAQIGVGGSVKDNLRAAILQASRPTKESIYLQTGWVDITKTPTYLHGKGGITANGNDDTIRVELPAELSNYDLGTKGDAADALIASMALRSLAPPGTSWVVLAATYAPVFGPVDFAVHLTGRTGTFKSEFASLFQSHYGPKMDARGLPASWSSTANALEAQAFRTANAMMVVDDFIPSGTSWQMKGYQQKADQLIRAQGNQAGRARLTDVSNLQTTMYPRGLIFSTGEDTPEGHSVRGRMMIMELTPGDIKAADLTTAQSQRKIYPVAMAAVIQYLAKNPDFQKKTLENAIELRKGFLSIGHTRTPTMIGRLLATIHAVMKISVDLGAFSRQKATALYEEAKAAIAETAAKQIEYLEESDPVDAFIAAIRSMLETGAGHFRTRNGGVPSKPEALGFIREDNGGEIPSYKSRGKPMGWIDWKAEGGAELYLNVDALYGDIKRFSGGKVSLSQATMLKRLKDAGKLQRTDTQRQRNTVRVTAENHPRTVLVMNPAEVLGERDDSND